MQACVVPIHSTAAPPIAQNLAQGSANSVVHARRQTSKTAEGNSADAKIPQTEFDTSQRDLTTRARRESRSPASIRQKQLASFPRPCTHPSTHELAAAMSVPSTNIYDVDNVGPLTTVFSGPTSCLATTTYVGGVAGFYVAAFWDDVTACYPSGTQSLKLHTGYFYSPGICPSGWAPVVSLETDIPKTASGYSTYKLGSQTTAWLCCPS